MTSLISFGLLLTLGGATGTDDFEECLSFTVPSGWQRQPPKNGENVVIQSGTYLFGKLEMWDTFVIRMIPAEGRKLDALKDHLIAELREKAAQDSDRKLTRFYGEEDGTTDATPFAPARATKTTVSGLAAYQLDATTLLDVANEPVRVRHHMVISLIRDTYYLAVAVHPVMREKGASEDARAFLASLRLDRCLGSTK